MSLTYVLFLGATHLRHRSHDAFSYVKHAGLTKLGNANKTDVDNIAILIKTWFMIVR